MINKILGYFGYAKVQDPKDGQRDNTTLFDNIQQLSTDYFEGASPEAVEYLEALAYKSLNERKESHRILREDGRKTLSLLLGGMGLFFGLAVTQLAKDNINFTAINTLIAACAWLCFCCIYLLITCIQTIKQPPVNPDPDIFYDGWAKSNKVDLVACRRRYLPSLQYDIQKMIAINNNLAKHLNRARYLAAFTPALLIAFVISQLIT